jgi:hypothetical protein
LNGGGSLRCSEHHQEAALHSCKYRRLRAPATNTTCSERSPVPGDLFACWAAVNIAARFPFSSIRSFPWAPLRAPGSPSREGGSGVRTIEAISLRTISEGLQAGVLALERNSRWASPRRRTVGRSIDDRTDLVVLRRVRPCTAGTLAANLHLQRGGRLPENQHPFVRGGRRVVQATLRCEFGEWCCPGGWRRQDVLWNRMRMSARERHGDGLSNSVDGRLLFLENQHEVNEISYTAVRRLARTAADDVSPRRSPCRRWRTGSVSRSTSRSTAIRKWPVLTCRLMAGLACPPRVETRLEPVRPALTLRGSQAERQPGV